MAEKRWQVLKISGEVDDEGRVRLMKKTRKVWTLGVR